MRIIINACSFSVEEVMAGSSPLAIWRLTYSHIQNLMKYKRFSTHTFILLDTSQVELPFSPFVSVKGYWYAPVEDLIRILGNRVSEVRSFFCNHSWEGCTDVTAQYSVQRDARHNFYSHCEIFVRCWDAMISLIDWPFFFASSPKCSMSYVLLRKTET